MLLLNRGFSLLELMVALALSGLMLLGVFRIFDANFRAYNLLLSDSDIQENRRIVRSTLTKDVQNTGNRGCETTIPNFVEGNISFLKSGHPAFNLNEFSGFSLKDKVNEGSTISAMAPWHGDEDKRKVRGGTDVLMLNTAVGVSSRIVSINSNPKKIRLTGTVFRKGDYIMIKACTARISRGVYQVVKAENNARSTRQTLTLHQPVYRPDEYFSGGHKMSTSIYKLEIISYFVSEGIGSTASNPKFSLFRKVNNRPANEYIGGVDDFQVDFMSFDSGSGHYSMMSQSNFDTGTQKDASTPESVNFHLVLRSDSTQTSQTFKGPAFGREEPYPEDGRLRRLVSFTAQVRN